MNDYPWETLFGWEFIKAVVFALFVGATVFFVVGLAAGASLATLWEGGL